MNVVVNVLVVPLVMVVMVVLVFGRVEGVWALAGTGGKLTLLWCESVAWCGA